MIKRKLLKLSRKANRFYLIIAFILLCLAFLKHSTREECPFNGNHCLHDRLIRSIIWTHQGSGLIKYLHWIDQRHLTRIRMTYLNERCEMNDEKDFQSNETFIQIYILSFAMDLTNQSKCSIKIQMRLENNLPQQIYFKRKSIPAMLIYQQLDDNSNLLIMPSRFHRANFIVERMSKIFLRKKCLILHSEDLIHENIFDCEKSLIDFLRLIRLNPSRDLLLSDAHHFLQDSTWWDRSDVAERIANQSIPTRSMDLTYLDDFYYLHGNRSFEQYLLDSRRCAQAGIFVQLPLDTLSSNRSIDKANRCARKAFDCAFSDIYSFADRERFYRKSSAPQLIKCGFLKSTIFDQVRNRYSRNTTCQTIILTLITDCYDPLPVVRDALPPATCFVALLDGKTIDNLDGFYEKNPDVPRVKWDIINLGNQATPFSIAAKSTETIKTLSMRLFPLAKWIVWVDGKAHIGNIKQILMEIRTPIILAPHGDPNRTSEMEAEKTIERLHIREMPFSDRLNASLEDLQIQREQYQFEGFYTRSTALKLTMFDIGIFIYRNHHPCILRYLCAWHNEINYYLYRGQVSVYYPAERLNLTDYMDFLSMRFHIFDVHHSFC